MKNLEEKTEGKTLAFVLVTDVLSIIQYRMHVYRLTRER